MEAWKPIPGWPLYDISNHGNVRSWAPNYRHKGNGRRKVPVPRKAILGKRGYMMVSLCLREGGKIKQMKTFSIHRLVAMCFVPGEAPGLDVAHLDGSRTNNHFSNLKWCTRRENESHKDIHGTRPRGESHKSTLYCDKCVQAIKALHDMGFSHTEVAFVFGCSIHTVSRFTAKTGSRFKNELPAIKRSGGL